MTVDINPEYWEEYSNLQRQKHELIRCYLGGWFPKLGSWAGRVLYLDTHAGRGKHLKGLGSPLVALDTLLKHAYRDKLLQKSEFVFIFIEKDESNLASLKKEIAERGQLPRGILTIEAAGDDMLRPEIWRPTHLNDVIRDLRRRGTIVAEDFRGRFSRSVDPLLKLRQ